MKNLAGKFDWSAQFRTVITLILEGKVHQFEGIVKGKIIAEQKGTGGFGYDPIFVPEGQVQTLAEMSLVEKSAISHRARAFQKLEAFLKNS